MLMLRFRRDHSPSSESDGADVFDRTYGCLQHFSSHFHYHWNRYIARHLGMLAPPKRVFSSSAA
jgi:hypothetical protein